MESRAIKTPTDSSQLRHLNRIRNVKVLLDANQTRIITLVDLEILRSEQLDITVFVTDPAWPTKSGCGVSVTNLNQSVRCQHQYWVGPST